MKSAFFSRIFVRSAYTGDDVGLHSSNDSFLFSIPGRVKALSSRSAKTSDIQNRSPMSSMVTDLLDQIEAISVAGGASIELVEDLLAVAHKHDKGKVPK